MNMARDNPMDHVNKLIEMQTEDIRKERDRYRRRCAELEALARDGIELAIRTHPNNGPEMRRQLDSGELERRMKIIGAEVFDPTGRCRFALKARALLEKRDDV